MKMERKIAANKKREESGQSIKREEKEKRIEEGKKEGQKS